MILVFQQIQELGLTKMSNDEVLQHFLRIDFYRSENKKLPRCGFCWAAYPLEVYANHVKQCCSLRDKLFQELYGCSSVKKLEPSQNTNSQSQSQGTFIFITTVLLLKAWITVHN